MRPPPRATVATDRILAACAALSPRQIAVIDAELQQLLLLAADLTQQVTRAHQRAAQASAAARQAERLRHPTPARRQTTPPFTHGIDSEIDPA